MIKVCPPTLSIRYIPIFTEKVLALERRKRIKLLEKLVPTLHMVSVYALLAEFPGASHIASVLLTRLSNLLSESSKGHYGKDTANLFREVARNSIGSIMPAKSLEPKHTIKLIQELTAEIDEIEAAIMQIRIKKSNLLSLPFPVLVTVWAQ